MNLILVGYRGSGKSTVGSLIAKRLKWDFVDLDTEIARQAGTSIASIFATEGETAFRHRERDAFVKLKKARRAVIALGGGALMTPENATLAKRIGKVIWLRAPAVVLWSRIKADGKTACNRPDLTPEGGLPEIERLLTEREPVYSRLANHIVDTMSETPQQIAETIEMWMRANDIDKG